MTYFAAHDLGMDIDAALYREPACRLMLLLNQHALANRGDDKMMTLEDIELVERRKARQWQRTKNS